MPIMAWQGWISLRRAPRQVSLAMNTSLSLYAVPDLLSRYTFAWMVSLKENSTLATQVINKAYARYQIEPEKLTFHQIYVSPVVTADHESATTIQLLSAFKTMKYQPDYPGKFTSANHARQ